MRMIDLEEWPRRARYEFFRSMQQPHYSLCAALDCGRVLRELKPRGVPPFDAILWCLLGAANEVPELRTRLRGEQVVEHPRVDGSVTVPRETGFAFCHVPFVEDWASFAPGCAEAVAAAKVEGDLSEDPSDARLYLSCLPWVHFSSMTNPVAGPDDCVPRITWGRFREQAGRWEVPVAIQVHHALVDGEHLGRFYAGAQERLQRVG